MPWAVTKCAEPAPKSLAVAVGYLATTCPMLHILCPLRLPFALRERASKTGVPLCPSQPSCFISGKHLLGGLLSFSANYHEMLEKLIGRLRSRVWGSSRAASRQPAQT